MIYIFGDVGVDHYLASKRQFVGGCAFNVAYHYQQQTIFWKSSSPKVMPIKIIAPMGDDSVSMNIKNLCQQNKIAYHFISKKGTCPLSEISVKPDGEKVFKAYHPHVITKCSWPELAKLQWQAAKHLHFNHFKEMEHLSAPLFEFKLDATKSCDFMSLSDYTPPLLLEKLDYLNMVQAGLSPKVLDTLLPKLQVFEQVVNITLGEAGTYHQFKKRGVITPAISVDHVVDTTGAGDAFCASILFWKQFDDISWQEKISRAQKYASKVIQHLGATPFEL